MLYFRPIPKLTVASAIMLAILIGLGIWQIQRLHWKLNLIASVNAHLSAPPLTLKQALALGDEGAQYHRVRLSGRFENDKEAYAFVTKDATPGYHVLTPFMTDDGHTLMVDRGFVPIALRDPSTRRAGQLQGEQTIVGVWRIPDSAGLFTPSPDMVKRVWYARDVTAIAKTDHVKLSAPVIVEADAKPNPGGWPKGGQTIVYFRNEHLQYAITWFALAAGLVLVYLAYHCAQGRLGFGAPPRK